MEIEEQNETTTHDSGSTTPETTEGTMTTTSVTTPETQETTPATTPATAPATTKQQDFDNRVARKMELWNQIKEMVLFEHTDQWKEIQDIDRQLLAIWDNGNGEVVRKEDK